MATQTNLETAKMIVAHGGYFGTPGESIVSAIQLVILACILGGFATKGLIAMNATILG